MANRRAAHPSFVMHHKSSKPTGCTQLCTTSEIERNSQGRQAEHCPTACELAKLFVQSRLHPRDPRSRWYRAQHETWAHPPNRHARRLADGRLLLLVVLRSALPLL